MIMVLVAVVGVIMMAMTKDMVIIETNVTVGAVVAK